MCRALIVEGTSTLYMDEDGRYLHIVLAYSTSTWMMMEDTWMRIVPSLRVRVRVRVEL